MLQEPERFRKFFNIQYAKIKNVAAVGSLIMLALTNAWGIYPYVEYRFPRVIFGFIPREWIGIPFLFFLILIILWTLAHIYVRKFEMYRTEQRANVFFNPYSVYALSPFQEMWFRDIFLPIMEGIRDTLPVDKQGNITSEIEKVKTWCDKGIIPKDHFPKHLKKYYITDKETRL